MLASLQSMHSLSQIELIPLLMLGVTYNINFKLWAGVKDFQLFAILQRPKNWMLQYFKLNCE